MNCGINYGQDWYGFLRHYIEIDGAVLKTLTPKEERVVLYRVKNGWTYKQIGEHFGFTSTRARQILFKAFRKLRHPSRLKAQYSTQPHNELLELYERYYCR